MGTDRKGKAEIQTEGGKGALAVLRTFWQSLVGQNPPGLCPRVTCAQDQRCDRQLDCLPSVHGTRGLPCEKMSTSKFGPSTMQPNQAGDQRLQGHTHQRRGPRPAAPSKAKDPCGAWRVARVTPG